MAYDHDIFVSYRRTPTVGQWVQNHLVPRLQSRIDDVASGPVRIFCDFKMAEGTNWPAELKTRLRGSKILVAVWSADYFRSRWCMAEWQSFRKREAKLSLFSDEHPQGLVYPVRYAEGDSFHSDAQIAQCCKDFSRLNYPDEAFRQSVKYLEFDDLVKQMAEELLERLREIPRWRSNFPVVRPAPLAPSKLKKPVI